MTAELSDRRHPSAYVQQVAANVRAECARRGYSATRLGREIFMNRASVSARSAAARANLAPVVDLVSRERVA